eukprot:scaffold107585_cov41-Prasinocladus_malaysianus.AAC.1
MPAFFSLQAEKPPDTLSRPRPVSRTPNTARVTGGVISPSRNPAITDNNTDVCRRLVTDFP